MPKGPGSTDPMDGRVSARLTNITLEYTCNGRTSQEKGRLLGGTSLLVEGRGSEEVNTPVEVRFRPTPDSPFIHAGGVVAARLPDQSIRVELTRIAEADRRLLLRLLYPPESDRRASHRVSLVSQVRTNVGGGQIVGYSRNVSLGGVYVETETPPAKGTEVTLRFKLNPAADILECPAVVAYTIPGEGMGLRFHDLPAPVRRAVEEFVEEIQPEG